jgi:hypothetical protein
VWGGTPLPRYRSRGYGVEVVLDDLEAAVAVSDRYDPTFQRTFAAYARHRGFVIDAAPPHDVECASGHSSR